MKICKTDENMQNWLKVEVNETDEKCVMKSAKSDIIYKLAKRSTEE